MIARTRAELVMRALSITIAKQRGRRAWALCPFHQDHDATNFFVRTVGEYANTYHCFACKVSGSLIDLVMKLRTCDFKTAKAFVKSAGSGYEPPRARVTVIERPAMLARYRFKMPPEVVTTERLEDWVTLARRYAISRALDQEIVDRYQIGYAVDGRLKGRIVFPVFDQRLILSGYSARSFTGSDRKYLTPHEDERADLDAMFGEHLWQRDPKQREAICVTEGAINAIACAEATGLPASSISGSDVRPGHVIKLATFKRVVLLTDPDKAGDKAARSFASSLGRTVDVIRVRLPEGKDAGDMTRDDLDRIITQAIGAVTRHNRKETGTE